MYFYDLNPTSLIECVSVNGSYSETKRFICGVPQGSVLGPILLLLYINDLLNILKHLTFFLFADDTNIYFEDSNLNALEKVMNKELKKFTNGYV